LLFELTIAAVLSLMATVRAEEEGTSYYIKFSHHFLLCAAKVVSRAQLAPLICFPQRPLHRAVGENKFEAAVILLRAGADPNSVRAPVTSSWELKAHSLLPLVAQGDGDLMTALHLACDKGFEELARLLVEHKADVSAVRPIAFFLRVPFLFSLFLVHASGSPSVVFVVRTENGGRRT
jgi:hypothetical protein